MLRAPLLRPIRLINGCHLFSYSVSETSVRIQSDVHPVVVQTRRDG